MKSLDSIRTGQASYELVVCIDGYPHLLSNAPQAAVQAAWAGTDFATTTVIGGLVVELENRQELNPWDPIMGGGTCLLKVQPDADDTLGIDIARTDAGAESLMTATADRDDLTIAVASTDGFPYSGEAYIGQECFSYSYLAGNNFMVTARGKYVANGAPGTNPARFAEHHRVANADNGVRLAPLVTQYPRTWVGRRVSVWWHTSDPTTGALNSKDDALCIFLGTITEPTDDESGSTHLLVENVLDYVKNAGIGRDQFTATLDYGHQVVAGWRFQFQDFDGTTTRIANDLVVVPNGTASGTNQIDEGTYGVEEIANFLNAWLGAERGGGRIAGSYTMSTPEDVNGQPRTVVHFQIQGTGSVFWRFTWPTTTWARCLGAGVGQYWANWDTASAPHAAYTQGPPLPGAVFSQTNVTPFVSAPLADTSGSPRGQYATLPAITKTGVPPAQTTAPWGIFILEGSDPRILLGYVDAGRLYCAPLNKAFAPNWNAYVDLLGSVVLPGEGPPKIRQIQVHEGRAGDMFKWLFYSTGTLGYNHPTLDVLPYGVGLGIPAGYLGTSFELSCDSMPGADDVLTVVIDKPVAFEEQFRADLVMRSTHLIWREGGLRFASWTSPTLELATVTLDASNKARPAGNEETNEGSSPAVLDATNVFNVIKINYNRDVTKVGEGGDAVFLSPPLILEDATSVDDIGPKMLTLDAVNVYGDTEAAGQGIRALAEQFLAWMAWWSRPLRRMNRPIDIRLSEGFGVADVTALTDDFVRDPKTGRRGVTALAGIVVKHVYNIGGAVAGDPAERPRDMAGDVDMIFLPTARTFRYAPAAELDETANTGGFTAGYDGATTLQLKAHEHSLASETVDIGMFAAQDRVKLVEIDPANLSAPIVWERTLLSVDAANNRATINAALSGPAFDTSKRYRLIFDDYADTQQSQRAKAFQAGTNGTIAQLAPANLYGTFSILASGSIPQLDYTTTPELPPTLSYGPGVGAGRDTGYDRELVLLAENLMDRKTARCSPILDSFHGNAATTGLVLVDLQEHFIGDMIPTPGIERYLRVGPRWAAASAPPLVQLRVTVSGRPPSGASRTNVTIAQPSVSRDWFLAHPDTLNDVEQSIPLSFFAGFQWVYVSVECSKSAFFAGFWSFFESERVV